MAHYNDDGKVGVAIPVAESLPDKIVDTACWRAVGYFEGAGELLSFYLVFEALL